MMKVQTTYAEIWRISWPIMLGSFANTVINFTDTAFVSRVGEIQLAAAALGGVFYFVMVMIGVAFGIGSQILIARKAGENLPAQIGPIYDHSLIILLLVAGIMEFLFYGLMPSLMNTIVKDPQVASNCIVYLQARGWGLIFMFVLISLRCFFTGVASTRIIIYTTLVMMLLNIILNYIFTLGHCGFSPMGIFGVGLASAISECIAAIYAIVYTLNKSSLKHFELFKFKEFNLSIYNLILKLSAPIVLQHFVSMGAWFLFFVLIEKMGAHELAVSNIVRSVYMVLMTPIFGYAQATSSMVSNVIGQKKTEEVIPLVRKIINLSVLTGILCTLLCFIFHDGLFQLTTSNQRLIESALGSFYVISLATIVFSAGMILLSAVSGTGNTKVAMNIELFNIAVYVIYVYIFTQVIHTIIEVVWGAEIVYWSLMAVLSLWYLKSGKWKHILVTSENNLTLS